MLNKLELHVDKRWKILWSTFCEEAADFLAHLEEQFEFSKNDIERLAKENLAFRSVDYWHWLLDIVHLALWYAQVFPLLRLLCKSG